MRRTYTGSCHCGAVRFEADVDLGEETIKCNCSICTKTRSWNAIVTPDSFRLLQGEDVLTDYQVGHDTIYHRFCSRCGVKPFGQGTADDPDDDFYAVNVVCLDDATDEELAEAPVIYVDGRRGDWESPPAETRQL